MNPVLRWIKFNLVGALGVGVQLGALSLFHRLAPAHLLWSSAGAVELAIVHNFAWHVHYTWQDRSRENVSVLAQLLRFQLSNGLISLLGNLALMPLLVHRAHLPLLVANVIAILSCSGLNFYLSNVWAFPLTAARAVVEPAAEPVECVR